MQIKLNVQDFGSNVFTESVPHPKDEDIISNEHNDVLELHVYDNDEHIYTSVIRVPNALLTYFNKHACAMGLFQVAEYVHYYFLNNYTIFELIKHYLDNTSNELLYDTIINAEKEYAYNQIFIVELATSLVWLFNIEIDNIYETFYVPNVIYGYGVPQNQYNRIKATKETLKQAILQCVENTRIEYGWKR